MDGTALLPGEAQPTVVMSAAGTTAAGAPRSTQVVKQPRSGLFWAGVWLASVVTVIGAVLGGWFLYFLFTADPSARNSRRSGSTPQPAPSRTAVKPSPSPEAKTADPDSSVSPSPAVDDGPIPITWYTTAATFGHEPGKRLTFTCPAGGKSGMVWGSDLYMTASSICLAAVHAGAITSDEGGEVTIEYRPGRSAYGSTSRNGVTTEPYGDFPNAFVVLGRESAPAN